MPFGELTKRVICTWNPAHLDNQNEDIDFEIWVWIANRYDKALPVQYADAGRVVVDLKIKAPNQQWAAYLMNAGGQWLNPPTIVDHPPLQTINIPHTETSHTFVLDDWDIQTSA